MKSAANRIGRDGWALGALLACAGWCAGAPPIGADDPGIEALIRIVGPGGEPVSMGALLDRLAGADVVFLGETHLDEVTHRVELNILEALAERRDGQVVLAMEMFATDVQPVLDDYVAGRIDEDAFLAAARPWKNYQTGYRPLIEFARARGLPVVASNIPQALHSRIARGGREAYEGLDQKDRALVPPELQPNSVAYWQRFNRAVAGHMGREEPAPPPDPLEQLYSVQSLWDNTMGWSCAEALQRHPGWLVLHVSGAFHTKYRQGTVEQLLLRRPEARAATVDVIPANDLAALDIRQAGSAADYLVFAQRRARGIEEGFHAVDVAREVRYRLVVPASATAAAPAPLLIWLPPEGLRAADGESYWKAALGDEAAIAILEPPWLEQDDDLHLGGRWYRQETFHDDVSSVVLALERIAEYVTRYYPVDPARITVAGLGTAATAVVAVALESDRLAARAVAVAPARTGRLIERTLPDLPPSCLELDVLVEEGRADPWRNRCLGYVSIGLDASVEILRADRGREAERAVRVALGLPPVPALKDAPIGLLLGTDSELARHWAAVFARRMERDGTAAAVLGPADLAALSGGAEVPGGFAGFRTLAFPGEWPSATATLPAEAPSLFSAADFSDARSIPIAAGPFGGTTVVVVPASAPPPERATWREIERSGAMEKAHGRFIHLAAAFEDEAPALPEVLDRLEQSGRSNVLIVPAGFCADAAAMQRLRERAADHDERMTISWLPGLGGSPHRPIGPTDPR